MTTTPKHEAERLADELDESRSKSNGLNAAIIPFSLLIDSGRHLRRIPDLEAENASLLRLLVDLRFALGDDGKRMQDELIEFAKDMRARLAELEAQRVALTDDQNKSLREAAQNAMITLDGIASTNPRDTADFENPAEWIAWAKSRARWAADALRTPVAQEIYAERVLKNMMQEADREGGAA